MNRRNFLGSASAISLAGIATTLSSINTATAADYKALVIIFLSGGYDGNNILVPIDSAYNDYSNARAALAHSKDSLVSLSGNHIGHKFGLSPATRPLASLFEQKRLAVVSNVGALIEPTSMSQFRSNSVRLPPFLGSHTEQEQWIQGWMGEEDTSGWGGRTMDAMRPAMKSFQPLIAMARDYTAVVGNRTALSLANSDGGSRWGMADLSDSNNLVRQRIEWASKLQSNNVYKSEFARSLKDAYTDTVNFAQGQKFGTTPSGDFPSSQIGRDLRYLAKHLSYSKQVGASRQIYLVQDGGYDTHTDQLSTSISSPGLEMRLSEVSNSIFAFDKSIQAYGMNNDVLTVVMSEFGRNLDPAAGLGTDHAWGNHWFSLGGPVKGGVIYGDAFPELKVGGVDDASFWQPYRGQWIPQYSSDQFIADLIKWLGLSQSEVVSVLPNLVNFPKQNIGFV
jgi:uncharacterized protein (DUF1501 family)